MKSLLEETQDLESVCEEIELNGGKITDELLAKFDNANLAHSQKVDKCCGLLRTLTHNSAFYSERSETLKRRSETIDNLFVALKERWKEVVKAHPDLPWKGTEGDKLRVQKNQPKLIVDMGLDKRSFSNVMYGEEIDKYRNFIDVLTLYLLNKEKVKAYLDAGNQLDWARMDQGDHLRWK